MTAAVASYGSWPRASGPIALETVPARGEK